MISLDFKSLALSLSVLLVACGGGGSDGSEPADQPATKITFIGNSLTYIPEWGRGLSSSDISKDYVHLSASAIGLPFTAMNFASLERNPADPVNHIDMTTPVGVQITALAAGIDSGTLVVVQLGDNAPTVAEFALNYPQLISYVKNGKRLACVSTFWENADKDAIIKTGCEMAGGTYVYVGDIRHDPANRDLIDGPQYDNGGVQGHPHDWSMARIAERVVAALR